MKNVTGTYEAIQNALIKKIGMSKHTVIRLELEKILDNLDKELDEVILGNL